MGKILGFVSGKKTYLFLALYAVLVVVGVAEPSQTIDVAAEAAGLEQLLLAGALASLRAGVSKVTG
jgi:hypothetical protein